MMRSKSTIYGNYTLSKAPIDIEIQRSQFNRPNKHLTTMNAGLLYPVYEDEILPGDSVKLDVNAIIRMATPIAPVMDDAYIDFYCFFTPSRLVWPHTAEFYGENKSGYWTQLVSYSIPHLVDNSNDDYPVLPKSVADYMETAIGNGSTLDARYPRSYALIWNEFFRDENLMPSAVVDLGDADANFGDLSDPWTQATYGGALLPVCKFHDRFTSALPAPQRGPAVGVPVSAMAIVNNTSELNKKFQPLWYKSDNTKAAADTSLFIGTDGKTVTRGSTTGVDTDVYLNLKTDGTAKINVTDLRLAFALQRVYEKLARSGTRFRECLKALYGVDNGDARMQVPEFLGHVRQRIGMQQVIQTSGSNISGSTTPQGNTAAYSLSGLKGELCNKSFTENGVIMVVCCIRAQHSYSQGIPRRYLKYNFGDVYVPAFAHLSEQPILNKELFVSNNVIIDEAVFGYQEPWSEYRYKENAITGEMRPDFAQSLDIWHYGDDYASTPQLSAGWIVEPRTNIDRTLAVTNHDQFICDMFFESLWSRPMPTYSIPGLIDHY